jgi:hypothetical protein
VVKPKRRRSGRNRHPLLMVATILPTLFYTVKYCADIIIFLAPLFSKSKIEVKDDVQIVPANRPQSV